MNFQTMNKQRKFILIAAVVGIISVFLPWVTVSMFGMSQSMSGFHSWGILVFLCFIAAAIVACMGDQTASLDKTFWMVSMCCGAVALLSIVISMLNGIGGGMGIIDAGMGFGLWISIAAAAGTILFAWMFKNPADTLKSGFDDLKKSISIPSVPVTPKSSDTVNTSASNKIAELEKLSKLRENGSITEEEFQQLKSKLM